MLAFLACTLCVSGIFSAAEASPLSLQITLYDLEQDAGQPVAVGTAPLTGMEQKAKLTSISPDPKTGSQAYTRDVFYVKRLGTDPQTGTIHFRVRHEQIIDSRCTAMEIREYKLKIGESGSLHSERGQIRAVMKFV